jgi:hypothetical protein
MLDRSRKRLGKRAKRGFRGYPIATVALYGPDDTKATKLTVGIVPAEDADVEDLRRWFSEGTDIRNDAGIAEEVLAFIDAAGGKSVVVTDRIIGCPHVPSMPVLGRTRSLDRQAPTLAGHITAARQCFCVAGKPARQLGVVCTRAGVGCRFDILGGVIALRLGAGMHWPINARYPRLEIARPSSPIRFGRAALPVGVHPRRQCLSFGIRQQPVGCCCRRRRGGSVGW